MSLSRYLSSFARALNSSGEAQSAALAAASVTPAKLSQPFTSDTAKASTSGTAVDFTGIPSWVRRITVIFNNVSTNGSSNYLIQLGDAGGFEITGYVGQSAIAQNAVATSGGSYTAGFGIPSGAATNLCTGAFRFHLVSGNLWICEGGYTLNGSVNPGAGVTAGSKTLSETLTQVRVTTVNGTDTFDGGSINIMYE